MEEVRKQVRRAYRRMGAQRFLGVLGWCWFGTLVVALVLVLVDKFYPLGIPLRPSAAATLGTGPATGIILLVVCWAAATLALAALMAAVWIFLTRQDPLAAAIEIDRRFALKERVSSSLALSAEDRQTQAGKALVDDAVRHVGRVDVSGRFRALPGRQMLLPLLPGVVALLVAVFVTARGPAVAEAEPEAERQQVKTSAKTLCQKLADGRQQAQQAGLKEAQRLWKRLEQGSRDMAAGKTDHKTALVKLNDLARQLEQRRQQLGGADKLKEHLDRLKDTQRGPADKFTQALRKGDFGAAAEELNKLQEQLKQGKLDQQQKKELAGQLEQVRQRLKDLAQAHKATQDELAGRCEQLRGSGQLEQASKLEEQLAKLLEQAPQMRELDELAAKLGQCARCLQDSELSEAAEALDALMAGLGDLQRQVEELKMMQDAMDLLAQARDRMNCPECGGFG